MHIFLWNKCSSLLTIFIELFGFSWNLVIYISFGYKHFVIHTYCKYFLPPSHFTFWTMSFKEQNFLICWVQCLCTLTFITTSYLWKSDNAILQIVGFFKTILSNLGLLYFIWICGKIVKLYKDACYFDFDQFVEAQYLNSTEFPDPGPWFSMFILIFSFFQQVFFNVDVFKKIISEYFTFFGSYHKFYTYAQFWFPFIHYYHKEIQLNFCISIYNCNPAKFLVL